MVSFQLLGFLYHRSRDPSLGPFAERWVLVPLWFAGLLSLMLPLLWIMRRLRNHSRFPDGSCLHCGYSLTGNVGGICPECGEKIDSRSACWQRGHASGSAVTVSLQDWNCST